MILSRFKSFVKSFALIAGFIFFPRERIYIHRVYHLLRVLRSDIEMLIDCKYSSDVLGKEQRRAKRGQFRIQTNSVLLTINTPVSAKVLTKLCSYDDQQYEIEWHSLVPIENNI